MLDGFTVVAQIINFLILVLLLRHFLYRPVIKAMDEREARIAAELEAAEAKQKEAQLQIETYRQKNQALDAARTEMLQKASIDVESWRQNALQKAFHEAEEARQHWQRALEQEKETFLQQVRRRASHQTFVIARKALADLADVELEKRIVEVFVSRLSAVNGSQLEALSESLRQSEGEVVIASAFELNEQMRQQVRAAVEERLGRVNGVRFETAPRLVSGIELKTQGHRLAWSIADYLDALEVHSIIP